MEYNYEMAGVFVVFTVIENVYNTIFPSKRIIPGWSND